MNKIAVFKIGDTIIFDNGKMWRFNSKTNIATSCLYEWIYEDHKPEYLTMKEFLKKYSNFPNLPVTFE